MRCAWFLTLILAATSVHAQVEKWQLGGSGMAWNQRDSLQVLIDFSRRAIQPRYLQPDQNVIHLLDNWQFWRVPSLYDLSYVDGQKPRLWNRWDGEGGNPAQSGVFMVGRDSTTYNAPRSQSISSTFFSIDTATPIPGVGSGYGRGGDHLAGGYCGRGVYHWPGVGRCVWRVRRDRGERKAGRL